MIVSTILLQAAAGAMLGKAGAALGAAVAAFAAAIGISKIGKSTMEAIARQPESAGNLRTSMIISAGMVEGAALFAIIVAHRMTGTGQNDKLEVLASLFEGCHHLHG